MRQDLVYALRSLRKSPGYAAVTILTLALGIGANTAIFSVVNGVILKPLPYPSPERLVYITSQFPSLGFDQFWVSAPEFVEFAESNRSFQRVGAYRAGAVNLGTPDQPRRVNSAVITSELMPALGVAPIRGRQFTREDTLPGAEDVAVLSSELWRTRVWRRRDGRRADRVRSMALPTRIVGIMPPGYDVHDQRVQVWLPLTLDPANPGGRGGHFLYLVGRLKDDVSLAQAKADLESMLAKWPQRDQDRATCRTPKTHRLRFDGLQDDLSAACERRCGCLQGAVVFVLLIACANLANLMLARAESRQREFAIRSALGAGRWRLLRQFLTEGIVLALVGGVLGAALGFGGLRALLAANPESLPRSGEIALDPIVLGFTVVMSLLTGVVFGLSPLLHLRQHVVNSSLKEAGQRSTASAARTLGAPRPGDVGGRAGRRARHRRRPAAAELLEPDERRRRVQSQPPDDVRSGSAEREYQTPQSVVDFFARLQSELSQLPGVQGVAAMQGLPPQRLVNANDTDFENYTAPPEGPFENVDYYQNVTPAYLTTLGIPLIDGRDFTASDVGGPPVALVNETLAKTFFRDQSPLGRRLKPGFGAAGAVVHDRRRGPGRQAGRRRAENRHRDLFPCRPGTARRQLRAAQHEHRDSFGAAIRRAGGRRPPRRRRHGSDVADREAADDGRGLCRDDRAAAVSRRAPDDCRRPRAGAGRDWHVRHPLLLRQPAPQGNRHPHGDGRHPPAGARDGARAGDGARRRRAWSSASEPRSCSRDSCRRSSSTSSRPTRPRSPPSSFSSRRWRSWPATCRPTAPRAWIPWWC